MKGRHRQGDTVLVEAQVTGVDEGNLADIYEKNADGTDNKDKVVGCTGDTFVHLNVLGSSISVYGSKLADPVKPITADEGNDSTSAATSLETAEKPTTATDAPSSSEDTPATAGAIAD